jgi:hypothetical protein
VSLNELSGRELDASVAQLIFELRVEERANLKTRKHDYLHAVGNPADPGWVRVPEYSVSTGPNLNVEAWLPGTRLDADRTNRQGSARRRRGCISEQGRAHGKRARQAQRGGVSRRPKGEGAVLMVAAPPRSLCAIR